MYVRTMLLAIGLAAAALLVACSGGDDDDATMAEEPAAATATATTPPSHGSESGGDPDPNPTPTATPSPSAGSGAETRSAKPSRAGCREDFPLLDTTKTTVDLLDIIGLLPPDAIPSIDAPNFDTVEAAGAWLQAQEPVIAFEHNGDARAYPLHILTWHEIVNDVVGGEPVIVTYCPLCNSAIVFSRNVDGEVPRVRHVGQAAPQRPDHVRPHQRVALAAALGRSHRRRRRRDRPRLPAGADRVVRGVRRGLPRRDGAEPGDGPLPQLRPEPVRLLRHRRAVHRRRP